MKNIFSYIIILSVVFACQNDEDKSSSIIERKEDLVEIKNGIYTEWYPGKKSKKFEGAQDEKYRRNGKWVFFSEGGNELSITFYSNGLKDGFSLVKYPNGRMHYRGEYRNDTMVGVWTTYDTNGKITKEKDYSNGK